VLRPKRPGDVVQCYFLDLVSFSVGYYRWLPRIRICVVLGNNCGEVSLAEVLCGNLWVEVDVSFHDLRTLPSLLLKWVDPRQVWRSWGFFPQLLEWILPWRLLNRLIQLAGWYLRNWVFRQLIISNLQFLISFYYIVVDPQTFILVSQTGKLDRLRSLH